MSEISDIQWLRISQPEDLESILRPALNQVSFNACSGLGHRERTRGRLLTLVGQRQENRTAQRLGIIFPEKPGLQQKAIDLISDVYAARHNGRALYLWMPKNEEI